MNIRNYEVPEGRTYGQPEVLVAKSTVEKLGMPEVNYDSLHQFMTDDLGIPYEDKTSIRLYGRSNMMGLLGFHVPYTRTIHVNAVGSESVYVTTGGTMRVVAHEGRHRSDSTNRKLVTAAELAGRWASLKLGIEVVEAIPHMAPLALYGGIKTHGLYYRHIAPEEKRARKQEIDDSTMKHANDILFPFTYRGMRYKSREYRDYFEDDDDITFDYEC